MKEISISLIVDEFDSHDDIVISITQWNLLVRRDSYHLHYIFYNPKWENNENVIDIRRKVVKKYLQFWYEEFIQVRKSKLFILPIGIYDQYMDILKFNFINENKCELTLGSTRDLQDYRRFNITDINTFYLDKSIEFHEEYGPSIFEYQQLVLDFRESIDNIDHCQIKESQLKVRNYNGLTIRFPKDE